MKPPHGFAAIHNFRICLDLLTIDVWPLRSAMYPWKSIMADTLYILRLINGPGVAGAVLLKALSLIN